MSTDLVKGDLFETLPMLKDGDPVHIDKLQRLFRSMTEVPEGMEETEVNWRPEIIKLKQKTSTDTSIPGDAEDGDIWANGRILWNVTRGEKDPMLFVPVYSWISHARFQNNERRPNCRSEDGKTSIFGDACASCPTRPWKDGQVQDCRRTYNFLIIPTDLSGIFQIGFSKTSAKAGTNITKTAKGRGRPLFENVYGLYSSQNSNAAGQKWYTYATRSRFDVTPAEEVVAFARFVYRHYKAMRTERLETMAAQQLSADEVLSSPAGELADTATSSGDDDFSDDM